MKKLISLLLILTLLTGVLPLNALASEDTFTLSQETYQKALRKAGIDAGTWHEGMSWSYSMSAYQKFCYLTDLRDQVVTPLKNRYVLAAAKVTDDSLDQIQQAVFAMESKLNYFIFDLETEINAVSNAQVVIASPDAGTGEKASAYRRIDKAVKRVDEIDKELQKGSFPGVWQEKADAMNKQLDVFFASVREQEDNLPLLAASSGESSFHVIILNTDQIGIEVRTKDNVAIEGADVTISSGMTVKQGKTAKDGTVIFPAGYFTMDDHHRMYAAIEVKKDGYRIWQSESLRVIAGEALHIQMEEDNGESYVQYATFRGVDVAHDTEHVYYTKSNDAYQSFRVGIHTHPGSSGVFALTYTPAGTETPKTISQNVIGTREEVTVLELNDKWCSMLAPEEPVTMTYHENAATPSFFRDRSITAEKAFAEEPLKEITGIPSYIPGTSFDLDIPFNLPGLKNLRFSMAFPWELFDLPAIHFAMTTTGNFFFSLAVASVAKITDGELQEGWKTQNSKETAEKYSDFVSMRKSLTQIAEDSVTRDGVRKKGMDLFKSQVMASFNIIMNGKMSKVENPGRDEDPYQGNMDIFVSAALDATVSFATPFMLGPVLCHFGVDLTVGIQAGLDLPFSFTTTSGGFNLFNKWNHISFDKEYMDIIISPRVSIAIYAGAGVKGLAGIYVRGYAGMTLNLHIMPMNQHKFKPEITMNAGVQIVAEFLFFSLRATLWEDSWRFDLDDPVKEKQEPVQSVQGIRLSAAANGEGTDEIHYVEPEVRELSTLTGVTDYRTVQVRDDFYAFWIEDQVVDGVARPWLSCAKIEMQNGTTTFVPVELPGLFIGKEALTPTVKVVGFDVTSTNDVPRHQGAFAMITLAVAYYEYEMHREFPNRTIDMTCFSTEFYNIVFFDSGAVKHYSVPAGMVTDQVLGSTVTGVSVSLAFDEQVGTEGGNEHADFYYYQTYTMMTSASPTTAHYGVTQVSVTPGRPVEVLDEYGFKSHGDMSYSINLNTPDHPVDEILQLYATTRNVAPGEERSGNPCNTDLYALATLTGTADEEGNKQSILIARDTESVFRDYRQETTEDSLRGDISAFRYIPGSEKEAGLLVLVSNRDETGRFSLGLTDHRFASDGKPRFTPQRDLGVRIGPASFDLVDLGASRALYYLESVSTDAKTEGYNIRAIYLAEGSDGQLYASRSFHLAAFNPADVSMDNGVSYLKLYADNAGFIQGFLLEKIRSGEITPFREGNAVRYTDNKQYKLKYFDFRQTLQAEVLNATTEQTLVKPGDTINVLFSLMNTGNIPANKVTLRAYALKDASPQKINLASILVNCENPLQSRVVQLGSNLPTITGREAVSRYDSPTGESMDTFVVSQNGSTNVYATEVLMPDETHTYRTTFNIPVDFTPGQYEIFVTFQEMSTRVLLQGGRYDAVSAWPKMLYNVDTQDYRSVIPPVTGRTSDDPVSLTMTMMEPLLSAGNAGGVNAIDNVVPVRWKLETEETSNGLLKAAGVSPAMSRLAVSAVNDRNEVPFEDADLSIRGRLSYEAGVETIHVVIRNEGMADAKNIEMTASVDETETFRYAFSGITLGYQKALSFDIPLSEITKGMKGENLILRVNGISVETNTYNNEDILPMNTDFILIRHPDDVFIREGDTAEYSFRARGGVQPYTCQWQVSTEGQYGPFRNITGATEPVLSLTNVSAQSNGNYYRVVLTDAEGRTITSNPALLMIAAIPKTGDENHPMLWLMLLAGMVPVLLALRKKKKLPR